jgi:hypothetical protein
VATDEGVSDCGGPPFNRFYTAWDRGIGGSLLASSLPSRRLGSLFELGTRQCARLCRGSQRRGSIPGT